MAARAESVEAIRTELRDQRRTLEEMIESFQQRIADAKERLRTVDAQEAVLKRVAPSPGSKNGQRNPTSANHYAIVATATPATGKRAVKSDLSRDIVALVSSDDGKLSSSDVADRLVPTIQTGSKKPPRRIVTNRIYMLKGHGHLVERGGKLWLAHPMNHG